MGLQFPESLALKARLLDPRGVHPTKLPYGESFCHLKSLGVKPDVHRKIFRHGRAGASDNRGGGHPKKQSYIMYLCSQERKEKGSVFTIIYKF